MDAKSKANFINSVANGQAVPCPNCNTINEPDNKICISCGSELSASVATNDTPAFTTVVEDVQPTTKETSNHTEDISVFAEGLPSWDIVPPQVMVRRR